MEERLQLRSQVRSVEYDCAMAPQHVTIHAGQIPIVEKAKLEYDYLSQVFTARFECGTVGQFQADIIYKIDGSHIWTD